MRSNIVLMLLVASLAFSVAKAQTSTDIHVARLQQAANAISQGQLAKAEELLNQVLVKSSRDADALNLLGVVRAQQQKPADAERLFLKALSSSPTHFGARLNLGELLLSANRISEALKELHTAHQLLPDHPEVNLKLTRIYVESGNYQQALHHLGQVPRGSADDYYTLSARTFIGLKDSEKLQSLIQELQSSNSVTEEEKAQFALLISKNGLSADALVFLESARRRTPSSFPILYALGVINAGSKNYVEARKALTEALAVKPEDVTTLRALANVARATGDLEKSLVHLIEARRLAPDAPDVLYDFGVTALKMNLLLDALPVFEQLHRSYPDRPAYLHGLAAVKWRKGEFVETVRLMKSYVAVQPTNPAGFYLLGAALLRMEQFADARAALLNSLKLKADADAEYLLGVTFEKEGKRKEAIETFKRVIRMDANHAPAHSALGTAFREAGKHEEARAALEHAMKLDPNDLRTNYQLGLVYAQLGEKDSAAKMFTRADELRTQQRSEETVILKLIEPPEN